MKPLVILGAGGYAQEVLWVVDEINTSSPTWDFLGFVDPAKPQRKGSVLYDRPVLGGFDDVNHLPKDTCFVSGIGNPQDRMYECLRAEERGWTAATLVYPGVVIAKNVEIGPGTVIGAGCILAPYARIGRHCALNLNVVIGHNTLLGDFSVLSPGVCITGNAVLEERVFVGTNATVYLGRRLGAGSSLAANSFLLTDLPQGQSAIGVPAKVFARATGAGICKS